MAVFGSADSKVMLPRNIAAGIITKTQTTSTAAKLSGSEPMRFGEVDYLIFDNFPRAEFVEEGAEKGSTSGAFRAVTAKPHKAQVTMRFNEEVQWQDEDYQLDVLGQLAGKGSEALSRALDLGMYHRIQPLTGQVISGWDNYLAAATKSETVGAKDELDQVIRKAVGQLVNADDPVTPSGMAVDPSAVWDLGNLQTKNADGSPSGVQRYPQLGLGTDITSFLGLNVAVGNTVSGRPEAKDNGIRALIGDFTNGVRWGVQRNLPVELIRFGDPDGQGDLKRRNQIALRLEIVFGWYVFADQFVKVLAPTKGA